MTKTPSRTFLRNLVLHCLDHLPITLECRELVHADIETLRQVGLAVNAVRSRYYSWFMSLISSIPGADLKDPSRLATQVQCLNLPDKNEELLLVCSLLIHVPHYVLLNNRCFDSVDVAARCLIQVFQERYRQRFDESDGWSDFKRHCEATVHPRDAGDTEGVILKLCVDNTPWCKAPQEKNILDFWSKKALLDLARMAAKEKTILDLRRTRKDARDLIFLRTSKAKLCMMVRNHKKLEGTPARKNCPRDPGFCAGCHLTLSYPRMANEPPQVEHSSFCRMFGKDPVETPLLESPDACPVQSPRLPRLVLDFVQDRMHHVFGSIAVKQIRMRVFRELELDIGTCAYCRTQCVRKLIVCQDMYALGCKEKTEC